MDIHEEKRSALVRDVFIAAFILLIGKWVGLGIIFAIVTVGYIDYAYGTSCHDMRKGP